MSDTTTTDWSNVEPHLWLGSYTPGDIPETPFKENILEFVERHNLTVVLSAWNTSQEAAAELDSQLQEAKERDIDVWLGTYDLREHTDQELVEDDQAMQNDIERLQRMVDTYAEYYPNGNVFVWHESPLTGQWTGDTRGEQAESIKQRGGEIFSAQKHAIEESHPNIDLGLMIHYPYIAPPTHTEKPIFGPLMSDLEELDALPDFTYFDFYRGYHEWDGGYEAVNDFLASVIENIREHTNDRPVYYLGASHSINNHYTPSKQAILGNLRAALEAGVDSYGWYIRKGRRETATRNYNPFIPDVGGERFPFNSVVGCRDRFIWSYLALQEAIEGFDPADRFDLWLYGHDFDFYEFDLSLKTNAGDWEFVGSFNGYLDGDNPYSGGDRDRVVAFHALERNRYLDNGELELRIEPADDSDGATLKEIHVVPHLDTCHYLTEIDATTLVEETAALNDYTLGTETPSIELDPTEVVTTTATVDEPDAHIDELVRPDQRDAFKELGELEESDDFSPRGQFDLWVSGTGLEDLSLELSDESIEEYRVDNAHSSAAVYRGLDRSEFFKSNTGGHYLDLHAPSSSATIDAVFVMPYHGSANFTTDAEAARIIERDYTAGEGEGQLSNFSLGNQIWPGGVNLDIEDGIDVWVQVPHRRIVTGRSTPEY